jgi:para-nitrobenzyl esterase
MTTNRRNFLKSAGIVASASTAAIALPITSFASSGDPEPIDEVQTSEDTIVEISLGKLRGYKKAETFVFKGIPYAASTEKENRFLAPQKLKPWTGIKNALVYGPICPQKINSGWFQQEYAFLYQWIDGFNHEDCLRLNIWTPKLNDDKKRPVLFWIHGGGFTTGSSQEHPSYDGQNLSELGDVVVVSVNHRLNVFGFADLSDYGEPYASSANVGMLDLVAALEWVKDHISKFGGDPGNVTIFGQSGGGTKVISLMAMPAAKGLFHKAIAQSNSIVQVSVPDYAKRLTQMMLDVLKINKENIQKIHQIPATDILAAAATAEKQMGGTLVKGMGRSGWQPVMGTADLPTHPFEPKVPEFSADIPFMVGSCRNEASASIDNAQMETFDEASLKARIEKNYQINGAALYKALREIHPNDKPVEILSYLSAQNPISFLKAKRKSLQKASVFHYMYSWKTKNLGGRPRSFHCSEIPFVFNNTDICATYTGATPEAASLSKKMAKAWINFARYGNPNHSGLPDWPAFNQTNGATMVFDENCKIKNDPDGKSREILERIFYGKEL